MVEFLRELQSPVQLQDKSAEKWLELESADTQHISLEKAALDIVLWNKERLKRKSFNNLRADPAVVLLASWIHSTQSDSIWA